MTASAVLRRGGDDHGAGAVAVDRDVDRRVVRRGAGHGGAHRRGRLHLHRRLGGVGVAALVGGLVAELVRADEAGRGRVPELAGDDRDRAVGGGPPADTVAGPAPVQSTSSVIAVWNGVVPETSLHTWGALSTFTRHLDRVGGAALVGDRVR